jgi:hypothetical protein
LSTTGDDFANPFPAAVQHGNVGELGQVETELL